MSTVREQKAPYYIHVDLVVTIGPGTRRCGAAASLCIFCACVRGAGPFRYVTELLMVPRRSSRTRVVPFSRTRCVSPSRTRRFSSSSPPFHSGATLLARTCARAPFARPDSRATALPSYGLSLRQSAIFTAEHKYLPRPRAARRHSVISAVEALML